MNALAPEFSRNLGFISVAEQEALNNSAVAIAGAGGDGGMLAIQLARMGVGELRLADPDPFEVENLNRQAACTQNTVNTNKAVAVGDYVGEINPDIKVITYTDGVTPDNVEAFIEGSDLLIDETEFTMHELGVMLARQAREAGIPNLMAMNVGFGTTVTTFNPRGKSFEKVLGLSEEASLDEIAEAEVPLTRWLPYLPPYVDLDVFAKVAGGEKSAPSVAPGVALAAGTAAVQAFLSLVDGNNRPKPIYAPKSLVIDAMAGEMKTVRFPQVGFYQSFLRVLLRNKLGLIPKADYA